MSAVLQEVVKKSIRRPGVKKVAKKTTGWVPGMLVYAFEPHNERGEPRRTKQEHPYSYDPFPVWVRDGGREKANGSACTDRIYQWNPKKHDTLCRRHFGNTSQQWDRRNPDIIEAFARDYFDLPTLHLVEIREICNWGSGDTIWQLFWKDKA